MPVAYRILSDRNLVFVRYSGFVTMADSMRGFAAYAADPGWRPGQNQLVDLGGATAYERDFAGLMAMQSTKLDAFHAPGVENFLVFYATNPEGLSIARFIAQSWSVSAQVIVRVAETEAAALQIIGLRETAFAALTAD